MARCGESSCGAADLGDGLCLGHADDVHILKAIARWRDGAMFDARSCVIDAAQLDRFLFALGIGDAALKARPLSLESRPTFCGTVNFEGSTFLDDVDLGGICFDGGALFDGAVFTGDARFAEAEFRGHADFDHVRFEGAASFRRAIFRDHAGLERTTAARQVVFAGAIFEDYIDLEGARFASSLDLQEATFQFARLFGPLTVGGELILEHCVFGERLRLEVEAGRVSASSAIFAGGGHLTLAAGEIEMDGVDFTRATTLSGGGGGESACSDTSPDRTEIPRLLTLRGALVSSLSLSRIDLGDCHFFGTHGLESMTVEPDCAWRHTPACRRCIDREMIVEEQHWREQNERQQRGVGHARTSLLHRRLWVPEVPSLEAAGDPGLLEPFQLAAIYRALRRSREDSKDQAGSGDLYYGEMEMRRLATLPQSRGRVRALCDRSIITAYWLLSGYGLKASRALLAWLILLFVAALALSRWGISPTPTFARSALVAVEGSSSLIRPARLPQHSAFTGPGEAIELALRVLGPILVGLFLLALRARVKR